MRVTYHPTAEGELIEIARFYERRVADLGAEFLKAIDPSGRSNCSRSQALADCRFRREALLDEAISVRDLLPYVNRSVAHPRY
jgi:hypothetical protein